VNLKCEFLVSKFAFKFNLYRYNKVFDEGGDTCSVYSECVRPIVESAMVGLHELNLVDSELEQAPGFNHRTRTYIK
jgi:hypothetical protein